MGPLSRCRNTLPGRPGLESQNRSIPRASPASELSSPRESVHTGPSCLEPEVVPLLVFRPSRAFSAHASEPRTRPTPRDRTRLVARDSLGIQTRRPKTLPRLELRRATRRTSRPLTPGEHAPGHESPPTHPRRQSPAPFEAGPRRLSTASPTPLTFRTPSEPGDRGLRSLAVRGKRLFSEEMPALLRFLCLFADLVVLEPLAPWLMDSPES